MAKTFGKGKAAAPAAAATKPVAKPAAKAAPAPVEEVEEAITEAVEGAATETATEEAPAEGSKKGSNAPRARKWNYGPIGAKSQAKILKIKDATPPKGIAAHAEHFKGGMTVEQFYATGVPDVRHVLRVAMRGKYVVVKDGNEQYPQAYDHAAAAEARAAKAAKKAAEQEAEEEVTA
jgi:hypothetical protein